MKFDGSFVTDLSLIFTLLQEHFILFDTRFDLKEKKNKATKRVEECVLKFQYKSKNIRLEITGNGLIYAHITGKPKKCFCIAKYNVGNLKEKYIQELLDYLQLDKKDELDDLGKQCAALNNAQFAA